MSAGTSVTATTMTLREYVQSIGAALYLDGVRTCPHCLKRLGSADCTCDPGTVVTRADIELATTGKFTLTVCEACGAFLPPDATSCPTCAADTAAFLASGPRDDHGQPLPAIHFHLRGGAA